MANKSSGLVLKFLLVAAVLAAAGIALFYALRTTANVAIVYRGKAVDSVPAASPSRPNIEMDLKGEYPGPILRSALDPGKLVKGRGFSCAD